MIFNFKKLTSIFIRDNFKTRTLHKSPTQSDETSQLKSDESVQKEDVRRK